MQKYLEMPIKEVITKFPEVGKILEMHNIGCVPCSVGSCLLKDIVEIHNLSNKEEEELLLKIARVIYPDREVKLPKIERKQKPQEKDIKYSPPMKILVDEHALIKKWIALIPRIIEDVDISSEADRNLILNGVDFIRSYADKFHHAKEEDVLFKYFDEGLDILKVIHDDHEAARGHVRAILEGIDKRDNSVVIEHLRLYAELLTEHIKKEDEILYHWMDRNLSMSQIGELFSRFNEIGQRAGNISKKYEDFINRVEKEDYV